MYFDAILFTPIYSPSSHSPYFTFFAFFHYFGQKLNIFCNLFLDFLSVFFLQRDISPNALQGMWNNKELDLGCLKDFQITYWQISSLGRLKRFGFSYLFCKRAAKGKSGFLYQNHLAIGLSYPYQSQIKRIHKLAHRSI